MRYLKNLILASLLKRGYLIIPFKSDFVFSTEPKTEDMLLKMYIDSAVAVCNKKLACNIIESRHPLGGMEEHIAWIFNLGGGKGSLNIYRKIKRAEKLWFSKYYFQDSLALRNLNTFNSYQSHLTSIGVKSPDFVFGVVNGNLVRVDFLYVEDMRTFGVDNFKTVTLKFLRSAEPIDIDIDPVESILSHFEIARIFARLNEAHRIEYWSKRLREVFQNARLTLSHGDLHEGNVIGSHLCDWDNFALRPLSLDVAFMFWKFGAKSLDGVIPWLEREFDEDYLIKWNLIKEVPLLLEFLSLNATE